MALLLDLSWIASALFIIGIATASLLAWFMTRDVLLWFRIRHLLRWVGACSECGHSLVGGPVIDGRQVRCSECGILTPIELGAPSIQPGADGKPPSTLFGGTLLLCDGHSIDPTTYPILSSLLQQNKLPDFTTYGYSLYNVGGDDTSENNFAARVNDPIFVPVENNSLDRANPLNGYNGNYTVYWVVQDITAGAIGDKFGVSLETLRVMNPDIVSGDQVIKACNNNLASVIALPNVPSVLTQLYCRLPDHNHVFQGEPTGIQAQSAGGGRNRIQGFSFGNNISTGITNKPDPNQYDSFDGYASTVAVVYYTVGDLQTKFTCP
jgi:hypothetical protein